MVDERLKAFAGKHLLSTACHPKVLLRIAVSNRHQYRGLFALNQLDGGAAVLLRKVHAEEGDASLLLVDVVDVLVSIGVVYHVAMLVAHHVPILVAPWQPSLQGGVNPVEVPTGLLVAVAVGAVLHHLACSDVTALVELPEDGVSVLTVAHVIVGQHQGDASALHRVPPYAFAYPPQQVVVVRRGCVLGSQHHLGRQVQRGQWWRCGLGHVLPIHGHIVNRDAVELTQPSQGIWVAQLFVLHQKVDDTTLGTTREALVTVALGIDDERAHRLVVVERAQRLVPHAALLQSAAVFGAVASDALLNHLLYLGGVE